MKLKYTLVFTIISFFITIAGFAQQYSDEEIGFDASRFTVSLKEYGVKDQDIPSEIARLRSMKLIQYAQIKKEEQVTALQKLKTQQSSKSSSSKLAADEITDIPPSEKAVLKALYDNNGGANWSNRSGWNFSTPVTSWNFQTQTGGWYGITVVNGHVEGINLVRQNITGILPDLTPLTYLKELNLGNNNLTPQNIPSWLTNLHNLEQLNLGGCNFNGAFPNLSSLQKLTHLSLYQNPFDVSVMPSWFTQLPNLFSLEVFDCKFKGPIPDLSSLSKLRYLEIGFADFSTETIPLWINNMPQLFQLDISVSQLKGEIPDLSNLTNLLYFNFSYNQLTGPIPNYFNNFLNLHYISLYNNKLTGPLPEVSNLKNLTQLSFNDNQITGSIPELSGAINLESINFSNNKLTGSIPDLSNLSLTYLNLNYNQLSGPIPNLKPTAKLGYLEMGGNQLTGSLPDLSAFTGLYGIDFSFNKLTGSIPSYSTITNLQTLRLDNNQLSGHIPSLTSNTALTFVSINHNKFRFVDFIDQFTFLNARTFGHSPQATIDIPQTFDKKIGDSVTFKMCLDDYLDPGDTFQWFLNGTKINTATGQTFTLNNLTTGLSGTYTCLSYHNLPGMKLALSREPIILNVTCAEIPEKITMSKQEAEVFSNISFSFESTAPHLNYYWNFYDSDHNFVSHGETSSTVQSFSDPGLYTLELTIDQDHCRTTFIKTFNIIPRPCATTVIGTIKTSSSTLFVNANTNFYLETTSTDLSYKWKFNLNNNSYTNAYGSSPLMAFNAPGEYKVSLVVTDQNGCNSYFYKTVTVIKAAPCTTTETGTIVISSADLSVGQYMDIHFDSASTDLNYNWTFYNPDNSVYKTQTGYPYIKFENYGNHRVEIEITDRNGCTANFSKTFYIKPDCTKSGEILTSTYAYIQPVLPNTSLSVLFSPYGFNMAGMQLEWEFLNPNGNVITTGTGNIFTVTPLTLGDYRINVKIMDPETGCINNFNTTLSCVDECTLTEPGRNGYITLNGDYGYSDDVIYLDLDQPIEVGVYRSSYAETGRALNLEWNLYSPDAQLISTGNQIKFPFTLTSSGGFYKVVVNVTDPENGCTTQITRKFTNLIQNSCTETNERSSQVKELFRDLAKKLILRTVNGETDAQINASFKSEDLIDLKPFIINSPKDKIYNYKTIRNQYNILTTIDFSFSPDRQDDVHISVRDGIFTEGYSPEYILMNIDNAIYVDVSQYISSDQILASCWVYNQHNRSAGKSILDPKDCRNSSEIRNINFCPPPCSIITGTIKTSTQEVFSNRATTFSLETTATDLRYKWKFYNLDKSYFITFTTSTVQKSYIEEGNYDISLEITDSNGCVTTFDKTVTATINTNCSAIQGAIKTSTPDVFVGNSTNFSFETAATDLSYKWIFTQGSESTVFTTKTVDYTYINPGANNVTLEVTDSQGCTTTIQKLVILKTGSELCDDVTQFGRAFIQVGSDNDLFKAARLNINETTNITFSTENYGPAADFTHKWSLLNENDQLVESGDNMEFPVTPIKGGFYKVVLDLTEHTSGCTHQFTRSIVCNIANSCAETNPQSSVVKGLLVNLLKNLISRSIMGETDSEINASVGTKEFNALKPYITSGPKDKVYNFTTTRNLGNEFTSVSFSLSPDRTSDIYISIPHYLSYQQGMSVEYELLPLIESNIHIDLSQYVSANQYLVSCYSSSQFSKKSLLKPNDCELGSEIRYIDFCPNECDELVGVVKMNTEKPSLNTPINFSLDAAATGLTYNWTFYNADNTVKESQASAIATHNYTIAGTYKVNLVVTDNNNCNSTFTKTINISPVCVGPTGTIKTTSPNIFAGVNNDFFFETTETNLTYDWTTYTNVNSGTNNYTTDTANAYYNSPGNYNVKLVVTNAEGCTNTFRTTAVVTEKPACVTIAGDIKTTNPIVYTNENTTFSFETTATNLTYNWTFHSLNNTPLATATTSTAQVVYPYAGDYLVTLVITDENNCVTTINKNITVQAKHTCVTIVGEIKIPTNTIALNQNTSFSFETTATNFTYNWIFYNLAFVEIGRATTSTVSRSYNAPGNYLVVLELTDQYNCKTYKNLTVKVAGACTPLVGTIKMDTEIPYLLTNTNFTFETTATNLTYTWNVKIPENGGYYNDPRVGNPFQFNFQFGEGEYTIMVDVKDSNDCVTHFEKIITPAYDCNMNSLNGVILNMNTPNDYSSPNVLINSSNHFLFYQYSNYNLNEMPISWEFVNNNGVVVNSATTQEFDITPTALGKYTLNLKITDNYNCEKNFTKDILVLETCEYNGFPSANIQFANEYNYSEVIFIDANQTKDLILNFYEEQTKTFNYHWNIYDLNENLIVSGNQENFPLTLINAGFYKIKVDVTDPETNCSTQFSKTIGCMINNSCTETNPKSQIVKELFLNVLRNFILRSISGETDEQINASPASSEFIALKPYITDGVKDKIYNFKSTLNQDGGFSGFDFSFSPDRESDVHLDTRYYIFYDPTDMEYTMSRIEDILYFALNQYVSPDQSLISCYADYGGKMHSKSVKRLDIGSCVNQTAVRYINFCPAEDCKPIIGILKSANVSDRTGTARMKVQSASKK